MAVAGGPVGRWPVQTKFWERCKPVNGTAQQDTFFFLINALAVIRDVSKVWGKPSGVFGTICRNVSNANRFFCNKKSNILEKIIVWQLFPSLSFWTHCKNKYAFG